MLAMSLNSVVIAMCAQPLSVIQKRPALHLMYLIKLIYKEAVFRKESLTSCVEQVIQTHPSVMTQFAVQITCAIQT